MLKSDRNHLSFVGNMGDDVLPVTAALHNIVHRQGYPDIVLDFSLATHLDPSFMLPLVTDARHYRSEKVDFDIVMPQEQKIGRLLQNANWLYLISPEKFQSKSALNKEHLSAIQYMNPDEHFKAVNQSMDLILRRLDGLDRSRLKALEWSLNEITDNVLNHSESPLGGILQVVTRSDRGLVQFYVCDAGIGIPRSLRSGRPEITDDVSAVKCAIQEGVTKNSSTNQGNGLFGTFQCCTVSGGDVRQCWSEL